MTVSAFAAAYARQRAAEGRGYSPDDIMALPWLTTGPHAQAWAIRARSFEMFRDWILRPYARGAKRDLDILDLGAGNGWLSYRLACEGHRALAVDIRTDTVDGLGAAEPLRAPSRGRFETLEASFDALPVADQSADLVVFNAALHYSADLAVTLAEARRVARIGGQLVIIDTPFYRRESDGLAMVAEKHADGPRRFGADAQVLLGQGAIEFLTEARLAAAAPDLVWHRLRVRYPLAYELAPWRARLLGQRAPSRFDVWMCVRT